MSQHDLNIANQGFPAFRADLNDALVALGSTNSGATAPATTYANQLWYDTANNILKIRNEDNDAWISIATLDQSGDLVSAIGSTTLANLVTLAGTETLTNKTLTTPKINVINEETLNAGVTIDGLLIKDGAIPSLVLPAGTVLQVVEGSTVTDTSTTSTSFVDSGLSATITPKFSSSKILVITAQRLTAARSDPFVSGSTILLRSSTELARRDIGYITDQGAYGNNISSGVTFTYLDSPATTSATTYKTQMKIDSGFSGNTISTGTNRGSIILMEIAG
jgi:hypothetical protein